MAGVTFLAFGNGSPDVFSTFAAMSTHSGSLAVGELIGAAGFITAVVAGSMALVRPFKVARKSFVRDVSFFIVAASFSMVFLADGSLHLWECATMVGFYLFYVVFVVIWHWWLGRRRRQRERLNSARSHFHAPGSAELEPQEEYHDDDEDREAGARHIGLERRHMEDFGALEHNTGVGAGSPESDPMNEDDEDEARERWLADISSNMRVSRRGLGERRHTGNPIRPSLVGALEFRAVLSSLQKSRNIQAVPLNVRRYSDDPNYSNMYGGSQAATDSQDQLAFDDDARELDVDGLRVDATQAVLDVNGSNNRLRAVSASDAAGLELSSHALGQARTPTLGLLPPTPSANTTFLRRTSSPDAALPSPNISVTPPQSNNSSRRPSPAPPRKRGTADLLAPPPRDGYFPPVDTSHESSTAAERERFRQVPQLLIPNDQSRRTSGASSPASPFPRYTDSPPTFSAGGASSVPSIRLPPPSISPNSIRASEEYEFAEGKRVAWWPYSMLPAPEVLAAILFPTLYSLPDKNILEKVFGIIAAPAVFLLTITLPVVESEQEEDSEEDVSPISQTYTPRGDVPRSRRASTALLPPDSPLLLLTNDQRHSLDFSDISPGSHFHHRLDPPSPLAGFAGHGTTASMATAAEEHQQRMEHQKTLDTVHSQHEHHQQHLHHQHHVHHQHQQQNPPNESTPSPPSPGKDWNRWLVCIQVVTAPFFVALILWANSTPDPMKARTFLFPALYALLTSLVLLLLLLIFTTPSQPPRWRFLMCFLGFVVSIAWISTIANEVVGVLKAFGVILGISDAILGLTIFAVGNSLGDLVADITVARLGFPVMALSACFGGPMLNILLGIGLSGLYMTVKEGTRRHEAHPHKKMKYKPYEIEVSNTLMISAFTLLVTLVGLLVVVPMNGWKMDRRIGWGLIGLWSLSTVGNVIVEVAGLGGKIS